MGKCAGTQLYRSAFMTSLLDITVVTLGCCALGFCLNINKGCLVQLGLLSLTGLL